MKDTPRLLLMLALLTALAPAASAQRDAASVAASGAAELATVAPQAYDYQPLPLSTPENDELYDNGPLANSPGTHHDGSDESVLVGDEVTLGYTAGDEFLASYELADDFSLVEPADLKGAVGFAYELYATSPTITAARVAIYTDASGLPGSAVPDPDCGGTFAATATLTDVYRVFAVNGPSTRRIQRVAFAFGGDGCQLGSGTYWIGFHYTGEGDPSDSGPWYPPVPRPLGSTGCPAINGAGAAQQDELDFHDEWMRVFNGAWDPCVVDIPFKLLGADAPSCDIEILDADLTYVPGPREVLRIDVTVRNNGTVNQGARLVLDYDRNGDPPNGTRNVGSGSLPAGPSVSRTINLPVGAAPPGSYNLTLRLEDAEGNRCGEYSETVAVSAPRVSGETGMFSVVDGDDVFTAPLTAGASTAAVVVSPNPFVSQAVISFEMKAAGAARLSVYDVLGRQVAVLVDGSLAAGAHSATFDASGLAPGVYVYRLVVGKDVQTGRMTLAH